MASSYNHISLCLDNLLTSSQHHPWSPQRTSSIRRLDGINRRMRSMSLAGGIGQHIMLSISPIHHSTLSPPPHASIYDYRRVIWSKTFRSSCKTAVQVQSQTVQSSSDTLWRYLGLSWLADPPRFHVRFSHSPTSGIQRQAHEHCEGPCSWTKSTVCLLDWMLLDLDGYWTTWMDWIELFCLLDGLDSLNSGWMDVYPSNKGAWHSYPSRILLC